MGLVGGTTDQSTLHLKGQFKSVQDLDRFGHDFGADAITGKDCDFHVGCCVEKEKGGGKGRPCRG